MRRRRAREFSVQKSRGASDGEDGMGGQGRRMIAAPRRNRPLPSTPDPRSRENPREFDGDALGGRDRGARASQIERSVCVVARDDCVGGGGAASGVSHVSRTRPEPSRSRHGKKPSRSRCEFLAFRTKDHGSRRAPREDGKARSGWRGAQSDTNLERDVVDLRKDGEGWSSVGGSARGMHERRLTLKSFPVVAGGRERGIGRGGSLTSTSS